MINFIKKMGIVIVGLIVIAGAFAPFGAAMAATFNTVAGDFPTLQVSNYTQHPGSNAYWATSVSANAGEVVSFVVYYFNTATDTANGTHVRVQLPSGAFNSTTISGDVWATNASAVTGSVSTNFTSSQTLTFIPGSVSWYPNQSVNAQALPNGQNGSEIISSSGLNLGDVSAQGWGTVTFRAQVGTTNTVINTQPTGSIPSVTTNAANSVSQNSATLNGSVNPNNSATTIWFEWGTSQSLGNTTGNQLVGSPNYTTSVYGSLSNLAQNTTYYYRVVAQNSYGTTYGNILSFTTQQSYYNGGNTNGIAPTAFTSSAQNVSNYTASVTGTVNPYYTNTNAWFEYGISQALGYTTGYQSVGSGNTTMTIYSTLSSLAPNTTYYYRVVAQNSYGTTYGNILSFTTNGNSGSTVSGNAPYVTTHSASAVYQNSALLNASTNPNGNLSTAWFEYGTSQSLGSRTDIQAMGQGTYASDFTFVLSGLRANTTYYYRGVAQNGYGTTYGNILSFTTQGVRIVPSVVETTQPRVIIQRVATVLDSATAQVTLDPSVDNTNPQAGKDLVYTVQYRNETNRAITNATLKVTLPDEVTYKQSTLAPVNTNDNVITFRIGNVAAGSQGSIGITVKIDNTVTSGSALAFGSTLNYSDARNQFQSASAYLTIVVNSGASGLASLASVIGSLLNNWFIDMILGLIIGFGVYHFFINKKEEALIK